MSDKRQLATGTLPVLPVKDVAKNVAWYENVLGFKPFEQPGEDGTVFTGQVAKQNSHIMLNLNPAEADGRGGILWVRKGTDVDAFYAGLEAQGVDDLNPLHGCWGDQFFSVRDLNGYILAFDKAQ